jgi:collagen type III alpha
MLDMMMMVPGRTACASGIVASRGSTTRMASPVDQKPAQNYVDFQEYVDFQLRKARQQIRSTDLLTAGTVAAVIVVGYLLAFVIADQWLFAGGLPRSWRWIGLVVWIGLLAGWLVWRFGIPLLRSVTGLFAARQIEQAEPELHSNLLNWVDLQQAGRTVDPAVLRSIERKAAMQLAKIDVSDAVDHRPLLRSGYALLAVMAVFCLYAVASPKKISPSLWRVLPMADVAVPTRTEIRSVTPGDAAVAARSRLEVTVDLGGVIPPQVRLLFTTADQKFRDEPLLLQPDGEAGTRFRIVLAGESGQGLLRDLSYRIEAGDAVSKTYRVTVAQPPSARVEQIQVTPPDYTRLPQETLAGGPFTGWEGSQVAVRATVNMPIRSARLRFLDEPNGLPTGEEVAITVQDGTSLSALWKLELREKGDYPRYYQIQCETEDGRTDPAPVVYEYTILIDQPPSIVLLAPERDLTVPANAVIPLLAEARDPDFELGPVTLQIDKAGETLSRETLFHGKQQAVRIEHDLALKPFRLQPGDEISFFLEAQDNRQPRRNRKQTPPLKIRIEAPTEDRQVQEQLAQEKARQREQLAELDRQNLERDPPPEGERPAGEPEAPREPRPDGEPPQEAAGEQPMPGDAGADEKQGPGSQGGKGEPSRSDGQSARPDGDAEQPTSEQDKLSPDGQDDQQLLQKLLEKFQREGEKSSDQGQTQRDQSTGEQPQPGGQPGAEPQPDNQRPSSPKGVGEPMPQPGGADLAPMPNQPGTEPSPAGGPNQPQPPGRGEQPPSGDQKQAGGGPSGKPGENGTPDPKSGDQPPSAGGQSGGQPGGERPDATPMPGATGQSAGNQAAQPGETGDSPMNAGGQPDAKPTPGGQSAQKPAASPTPAGDSGQSAQPGQTTTQPGQTGTEPTAQQKSPPGSPTKSDPPAASGTQTENPEKQPGTQNTQRRDGAPDGAPQPLQGEGQRPSPRSDQPQGGQAGGSQQAQDGDSGSRQRGPGESTGRPGEQESGASQSQSMKSGEGAQSGGKSPAGGQDQAGGQQKSGGEQPGQPSGEGAGKPDSGDQKSGSEQSGQQQGGQQQGGQQQGGQQQGGQQQGGQQQGGQQQGGQQQGGQQQGGPQQGGPQSAQQGGQQQGGQQPGGQAGEIPKGAPSGAGGESGPQRPGQRPGGGEQPGPDGEGGGAAPAAAPPGDPANLEFKKQAAELVLQRLKDGLERGDVDPQLLDELGWTNDEMQRFVNRLSESLHGTGEAESPEAIARRVQFEEMLRSLKLDRVGAKRTAGQQPSREVDQIESRRAPVPGEYRKAWERYTRELSKQPPAPPPSR